MKSALETAASIRNQTQTVSETVEQCIQQIEKWNPKINAVVETCFDQARAEAKQKDRSLSALSEKQRKSLPVLFGVPFTCKEMISNRGLRLTMGSIHYK